MRLATSLLVLIGLALGAAALLHRTHEGPLPGPAAADERVPARRSPKESIPAPASLAQATFASGCFWCTEAVFQRLKGVKSVVSGYTGGAVPNPTYDDVCTGMTGHAEAVQVTYDPAVVSYEQLLEVFWQTHDPTTVDQQGNDVGPQYRSAIFTHNDEQRRLAEHYKQKLDQSGVFGAPIVTEIVPFTKFYKAEGYHQDYFNRHAGQPYCQAIIVPKIEKLKKVFGERVKPGREQH